MSALIPYAPRQVGAETVQTVDGRHICAFLGIARDYSDWVRRQIKSGQLIENRDFTIFYNHVENSRGRPSTEYHFTFRAAEHIGMMSRTAKGREIREYFLDLEQQTASANTLTAATPGEVALALAQAVVTIERRQLAIEARQDEQAEAIRVIQERQPPANRMDPIGWLRTYSMPTLEKSLLKIFRAACRRRERPIMWRPDHLDFSIPYYTESTLEQAYEESTRQIHFFEGTYDPGVSYLRQRRRRR